MVSDERFCSARHIQTDGDGRFCSSTFRTGDRLPANLQQYQKYNGLLYTNTVLL